VWDWLSVVCPHTADKPFFALWLVAKRFGAVQVADRWHLLRNLSDALRTVVSRHRKAIRHPARSVAVRIAVSDTSTKEPVGPATKLEQTRQHNRQIREERYAEMRHLRDEGVPPSVIASVLGVSKSPL